jgi:hypothetical protein
VEIPILSLLGGAFVGLCPKLQGEKKSLILLIGQYRKITIPFAKPLDKNYICKKSTSFPLCWR